MAIIQYQSPTENSFLPPPEEIVLLKVKPKSQIVLGYLDYENKWHHVCVRKMADNDNQLMDGIVEEWARLRPEWIDNIFWLDATGGNHE